MKTIKEKRTFETFYCVSVIIAFICVSIWTVFHLPLPRWLVTDLSLSDSSFVILQIQVTIAVLPLAIIALITGISKDTLYGVSVIKYVMYLRPVFLTYRRVATIQMLLIIIAFACTSYQWYNHLELTFFVTLFNSLIMMVDCFSLLSDYQLYKSEIRAYLVSTPTQEKFSTVVDDTIKSASTAGAGDLKEKLEIVNEMLFSVNGDAVLQKAFNSEYIKCANRLFALKDSDIFFCTADALQTAYHKFNETGKESHIFTAVSFEFYTGLKYLNLADAHKYGVLNNLRFELFHNPAYNNDELCSFTAQIYRFAVIDNIYPLNTASSKNQFVTGMYDWFSPFQVFLICERHDRLNFFKSLVDNRNKTVLDEKVYKITDIRPDTDLIDKLFIILYFYYIGICEPLADNDQIQFCCDYIRANQNCFKSIIVSCAFHDISNGDITLSYNLMRSWEVVRRNCVKTLMFDSVTNDFWVFSFMAVNSSAESLSITLQKIADGKEFTLYIQYFADDTIFANTLQKYTNFCNLFGFEFNEAAVNSLKSVLSESFKQSFIQNAKNEHNALMENGAFLPKWTQIVEDYCGHLANHFSNKPSEVISEQVVLFNYNEFCFELSRKENERLQDAIEASILAFVCRAMQSHLKAETVNFGEPIFPKVKTLNDSYGCSPVDTAIGSRNCFSYRERNEEQQILEEFGEEFLSRFMTGAIFFVSRSGFFADFSNIKIHLLELTREEILAGKKPNENGIYSYVITNNLTGNFTEDELVTFIQNRSVNLKITCNFTYGFSSEQIGYGIVLQFPRD